MKIFADIGSFQHRLLLLFLGAPTYSLHPRFPLKLILTDGFHVMNRVGQSFSVLFQWTRLPLLPWRELCPSCCHVNHRPTGSRLFTLMSLSPRFDYCNCLSTMCSVSSTPAPAAGDRAVGSLCHGEKGSFRQVHVHSSDPWTCLSIIPKPSFSVLTPKLLLPFIVHYVSPAKDISLDFNHGLCGQILHNVIAQGYLESCVKMFVFIWNCWMP